MRKAISVLALALAFFAADASAQVFEDEKLPIDKVLEADAQHNLDVAWQYFKMKKAYKAALMRTEETLATLVAYPTFSKMDEVLFLYGMSSYYLAEGKGKQKIDLERLPDDDKERFEPERLAADAKAFLSRLVEEHPESKYRKKAEEALKEMRSEKN